MKFQPGAWSPPKATKLQGDYARNQVLATSRTIDVGGIGPEDVLIDQDGSIVVGLEDGRVVRCGPNCDSPQTIANTGGRPLGIEIGPNRELIICDAQKGLLSLAPDGALRTIVSELGGVPFRFTNNATVASDGTVYFTDSSRHFSIEDYRLDILEHGGTGRLLAYRPDASTEVLLDGLHFPNGVALDSAEQFLLFAETSTYSIRKYWLSGPNAGKCERFVENLPGFPDNLSQYEGRFWVAIPTLRDPALDWLLPRPWIRQLVVRLPIWMQPKLARHGFVVCFDANGRVVHNLQDSTGKFAVISGVRQHGDKLYLGNLTDSFIAVHDLSGS